MSEEELVIFDILTRPSPELGAEERAEVKKVARDLLTRLKALLVLNWRQKSTARSQLKLTIEDTLDSGLPRAYTPEIYRDAIITNMKTLKRAFPKSIAMVYANFMPGEWRPTDDKGYLRAVYQAARDAKIGVGGPDLFPYKPGQMGSSYSLIHEIAGDVPVGIAFQDGNQDYINPKTGKRVTIPELIDFAQDYLRANYIFWCTEELYYSQELVQLFLPALLINQEHLVLPVLLQSA